MLRIAVCGINGKMGQVLAGVIKRDENTELSFGVDVVADAYDNNVPVYSDILQAQPLRL